MNDTLQLVGESIACLIQTAEVGEVSAAYQLGERYRLGSEVPLDNREALRWYRVAAEGGDAQAQNDLATMLLNELGCERDPAQAVQWYRKSAEQGLAIAQYNLAKRYLHGDGIEQDYARALEWFRRAAVQGEAWATCEMGTMYRLGQGVERNLLAAAEFHLIAAEKGDDVAILGNLAEYRAELEKMALSGSQMASLFLSRIYNRGFGVEKSQPMTWAWISWAKKRCSCDTDAETVREVTEAFTFYHCIPGEVRKEGERMLAELRAAKSKQPVKPRRVSKSGAHRPQYRERQ